MFLKGRLNEKTEAERGDMENTVFKHEKEGITLFFVGFFCFVFFYYFSTQKKHFTLDTLAGGCEGCVGCGWGCVCPAHMFCPCVFITAQVQPVHVNLQKEGEWLSSCVAEFFFHL